MIRDAEDLIKSVRAYVKATLNAKIDAINAQKNDDYDIDQIKADDEHYVCGADLQDIPNHAFVNFALSEIEPRHMRGNLLIDAKVTVEVAFDNPKNEVAMYQSMRYMRALYETILGYQADEVSEPKVTVLKPLMASLTNRQLIISGVEIVCSISN